MTVNEVQAKEKLTALFDGLEADGKFKNIQIFLSDRKALENSRSSYETTFSVQISNRFSYEVIKSVVHFCQEEECNFFFLGTHFEWRDIKFEIMAIRVETTV